jgi:glycosyltransferase involved in cell wall biosynthesis
VSLPVLQLLGRLRPGDPASVHALGLDSRLRERGRAGGVYAEEIDPRLARLARPLPEAPRGDAWRVLHHPGRGATRLAAAGPGRLAVAVYETPSTGVQTGLGREEHRARDLARRELVALARGRALGLAASASLREPLLELGFARVEVLPPCPDPAVTAAAPAPVLRRLLSDQRVNVLFAGRVAPGENLEELLRVFAVYQRFVEPASRLLIAGDFEEHPGYFGALSRMADELRLDEVVFQHAPGPGELRACYAASHVFLSLGREEAGAGRQREALANGVPVIALDAGAVRERLAGGGVLVPAVRHAELAELIDLVSRDPRLREALAGARRAALASLHEDPAALLLDALEGADRSSAPPGDPA